MNTIKKLMMLVLVGGMFAHAFGDETFKISFISQVKQPFNIEYRQFGIHGNIERKYDTLPAEGKKVIELKKEGFHPFTSIFFYAENPEGEKVIPEGEKNEATIRAMKTVHNNNAIEQQEYNKPYTHTFQVPEQKNTTFTISNCSFRTVVADYMDGIKRNSCDIAQETDK